MYTYLPYTINKKKTNLVIKNPKENFRFLKLDEIKKLFSKPKTEPIKISTYLS